MVFSTTPAFVHRDSEAYMVIVGFALLIHLLFKRFEFQDPLPILLLLGGIPAILTTLLVPHFSTTLSAATASFATYFTTLVLSIGFYRAAPYHPLAKYPGPFLNKLSKFRMVYVAWTGKQHEYYAELHRRYGDIVRTGPNEVYIRDPSAILPLMGTTGWSKSPHWEARTLNATIQPIIAIRDQEEHHRRRRTWTRGFSSSALQGYEDSVVKRVVQLCDYLMNEKVPVDFALAISYFAFDVITDMAFGGGTQMLLDGDKDGLLHQVDIGMKTATLLGHVPWSANFVKQLPGVGEDLKQLRKFGVERAVIRRKQGVQSRDLFYYLADEDAVDKAPIPFTEVVSDGGLVLIAGYDTTAVVLSSLLFYLVGTPSAYSRLQVEVDKFVPRGETPSLKRFSEMHYLDACINEALRLSPPVMSGSPRSSYHPDPLQGKMIGPYYIPEGTTATVNILAIQRDPRNFRPSPNTFWPERWLIAQNLEKAPIDNGDFVHNMNAFIPFSFGPANCVGKPLAMLEMRTTIMYIMHTMEIKFAEGYGRTWESDRQDFFITKKGKLPLIFTPRI